MAKSAPYLIFICSISWSLRDSSALYCSFSCLNLWMEIIATELQIIRVLGEIAGVTVAENCIGKTAMYSSNSIISN